MRMSLRIIISFFFSNFNVRNKLTTWPQEPGNYFTFLLIEPKNPLTLQ